MATSLSEPTKKRILQVCVKLFLEQGYKKTTMAEIIAKSSVSSSSFQNIFRAKDGVLTELVQFMFENQFSMARSAASTKLPPVYVYAVETAIQKMCIRDRATAGAERRRYRTAPEGAATGSTCLLYTSRCV